uniref:Uncharacterized protein n=1 Tax=viral metagenome TaxID=1070528 RepID=A0A6C0CN21_9ZZZZ
MISLPSLISRSFATITKPVPVLKRKWRIDHYANGVGAQKLLKLVQAHNLDHPVVKCKKTSTGEWSTTVEVKGLLTVTKTHSIRNTSIGNAYNNVYNCLRNELLDWLVERHTETETTCPPPSKPSKIIFIDIDNASNRFMRECSKGIPKEQIYGFHGAHSTPKKYSKWMNVIGATHKVKDAADINIAYYASKIISQRSPDQGPLSIYIISNDKCFIELAQTIHDDNPWLEECVVKRNI